MTRRQKRYRADFWGSLGFVAAMIAETIRCLPRLWRLSRLYARRPRGKDPTVVLVGDNMDSVHGISTSSIRLVRDLEKQGHSAFLLGLSHSAKEPGSRNGENAVWMLPTCATQDLFGYEGQELAWPDLDALCRWLERNPVDLIEVETPGTFGLVMVFLARWLGIPLLHNYRTDLLSYTKVLLDNFLFIEFLHWFIRSFLRSGGHVIVPSDAFLEEVVGMGLARSCVRRLPRGVDLSRFSPAQSDPLAWPNLGAPSDGPIVAFLGRVSLEKGLDTLAEAFPLLLQSVPNAVLGVIGDGPYRKPLKALVEGTGRFAFSGEVEGDDLPRLLASARILAFPSTTDTFGNAVLEALACGIPAIVTDQGGPKEIVEDGKSGLIIPGNNPRLLSEACARLLQDTELWQHLSEGAQSRARAYDPQVATRGHWEFYLDICR